MNGTITHIPLNPPEKLAVVVTLGKSVRRDQYIPAFIIFAFVSLSIQQRLAEINSIVLGTVVRLD